ncbi:5-formyltetrahydrofolate cyclo-ligase, partial [Mycobacterium avium]|uniref:5-formyltetrahydrofolate cyclo-ligase n=1 Tax=Mycobacterium avium TaxID=1764 RepID=UPI0005B633DC
MATTGKAALRERLLAARRRVADDVRAAEARMLREQLEFMVTSGSTVCAYVPVGAEPGSVEMLDMLLRRAFPPPAADDTPLPLCWGEYRPGTLTTGRWGLLEPAQPWLPASALADAALVLVPALAVDRRGVRLGRGRGFYDRSLGDRDPRARLGALVRDAEPV